MSIHEHGPSWEPKQPQEGDPARSTAPDYTDEEITFSVPTQPSAKNPEGTMVPVEVDPGLSPRRDYDNPTAHELAATPEIPVAAEKRTSFKTIIGVGAAGVALVGGVVGGWLGIKAMNNKHDENLPPKPEATTSAPAVPGASETPEKKFYEDLTPDNFVYTFMVDGQEKTFRGIEGLEKELSLDVTKYTTPDEAMKGSIEVANAFIAYMTLDMDKKFEGFRYTDPITGKEYLDGAAALMKLLKPGFETVFTDTKHTLPGGDGPDKLTDYVFGEALDRLDTLKSRKALGDETPPTLMDASRATTKVLANVKAPDGHREVTVSGEVPKPPQGPGYKEAIIKLRGSMVTVLNQKTGKTNWEWGAFTPPYK